MIPFDELCQALARWRTRNGMDNGPSALVPQPAFIAVTTEEILGEQATIISPNPLAGPRPADDTTNEIEIDNLVLDADDV
jgi:hypothetical protein